MGVIGGCRCGNYVTIASEQGERQARCPQCGATVTMPVVAPPGGPAMVGGGVVPVPTMIPSHPQAEGKPVCCLVIQAHNVTLNAQFDTSGVLTAFAEAFAKKLRKHYRVELASAPRNDCHCALVNVLT